MNKPTLPDQIKSLLLESDRISNERKDALAFLARTIVHQMKQKGEANVTFVCTHNSRRSQLAQLWLYTATHYFDLNQIQAYSSGTEATAFNPRMVKAVREFGFILEDTGNERGDGNPEYKLKLSSKSQKGIPMFSKKLSHPFNPQDLFIAVMVCTDADENCPYVPGTVARISLPYEDPKAYDNTPNESIAYKKKVREIGREIIYMTGLMKNV